MLSDREVCQDVLLDLKYLSMCGAVFAGEASPNVKHIFLDQLRSHQDLHTQFVRLMEQRGWYPRVPGDLGFNQPWGQPYAGTWHAPAPGAAAGAGGVGGGVGGTWQQAGTPVGGGTWQAGAGGAATWQAQPGWAAGQGIQAIGQNLRETR